MFIPLGAGMADDGDNLRRTCGATDCQPTPGEREIPLARGERFPPEQHCGLAAVWRLVREA